MLGTAPLLARKPLGGWGPSHFPVVPETLSIYNTYRRYRGRGFKELQKAFKVISGSAASQPTSSLIEFPLAFLISTALEINGRLTGAEPIFCGRVERGGWKADAWIRSASVQNMGDINPLDKTHYLHTPWTAPTCTVKGIHPLPPYSLPVPSKAA